MMHILSGREWGGISTVVFSMENNRKSKKALLLFLEKTSLYNIAKNNGFRTEVISSGYIINPISLIRIIILLKREKITLIHTHSVVGHIYGLFIKIWMRNITFLLHVHANVHKELSIKGALSIKRNFYYYGFLLSIKKCDRIIANSTAVRKDLLEKGIEPKKVSVVYNGVNVKKIEQDASFSLEKYYDITEKLKDNKIVGTVGRLAPVKNQRLMIEAAGIIVKKHPDVVFLIIGEGKERKNLEKICKELGISENIIFTGWLNTPAPLVACMDIFVLPSLWEGMGVVLLEAMSLGKPVVATRVGGVPEVVKDNETGILVDSENTGELADALLTLLFNRKLGHTLGKNGRRLVEKKFSLTTMVEKIEKIYDEARKEK